MAVSIAVNSAQTFLLGGTGLDNIEDVNVTSGNSAITWTTAVLSDQTSTTLQVVSTPSVVSGSSLPSGQDQVMVTPVGSGYTLSNDFELNSVPLQCTVLPTGTVYQAGSQIALVVKYLPPQ